MIPVVIMAGGRGERLHPLTEKTPKPMLPVGGKPILETVIDGYTSQGFRRFYLCVNYRKECIEGYFGDGSSRGVSIHYTHEKRPMGTAGALALLPEFDEPAIVSNADVIAKVDYLDLLEHHKSSGADATACASLYQHQIPYGVIQSDECGFLQGVREKPIEDFPVMAGIYVLEPHVMAGVDGRCDMPDLLARYLVSVYAIQGYWCDVGRWEDYARANAI